MAEGDFCFVSLSLSLSFLYTTLHMSSPLPANAKQNYHHREDEDGEFSHNNEEGVLSSSFDRAASIARLGSPVPHNALSSSPPRSEHSVRSYGSAGGADLEHVPSMSSGLFRPLSNATYNYDDNTLSAGLPEDQVARVVKRHLVETSPAASILSSSLHRVGTHQSSAAASTHSHDGASSSAGSNSNHPHKTVHQLPGGAITHDIYKWAESADAEQSRRGRTQSMYIPRQEPSDPALARLKDPGGFRRHYVYDQAARRGREPPHWMTRTFVDFLALYGHFGGEDLSDYEDEDEDEDAIDETTGLLRRRRRRGQDEDDDGDDSASRLIRRAQANAVQGTATPSKAVFLLLKSFVGTGTPKCG